MGKESTLTNEGRAMIIPFLSARKKAEHDACLDSFLSFLVIELETKTSFEIAFQRAAHQTSLPLRTPLESVLVRFRECGMSMDESLASMSREVNTPLFERAAGLLRHVYAHGSTPPSRDALRRMLEDVREAQRVAWKAYAQKLVLLSLVFIGVSALVPALFLAFVTIGSRFLELSLTTWDILLASLLLFPLVDSGVLCVVWWQMPPQTIRENAPVLSAHSFTSFLSRFQTRLNEIIRANGIAGGLPRVVFSSTLEGVGLFIIAWSIFLREGNVEAFWVSVFLSVILGPLLFNVVWQFVQYEKNTHRLEQQAADSLLILSSIPTTVSFLDHLRWLAKVSPQPIGGEWNTVVSSMEAGKNPMDGMEEFGRGRSTPILDSVRGLLTRTYSSGIAFGEPSRTLAQEIITHHASLHERRAVLLVEKYTILLAGGLLVPFLLGILTGVVSSLPLGGEFASPDSSVLFETSLLGMRGYLFMYSILAGIFVGFQDGKPAQSIFYALILLPLSQSIYALGQWWMAA